jgi:hypothetical protein
MVPRDLYDATFRTDWDDVGSFRLLDVPVLFPTELPRLMRPVSARPEVTPAVSARGKRSSQWPASFWESSIDPSKASACSRASRTLYSPRKRRHDAEDHRLRLHSIRLRAGPAGFHALP